MTPRVAHVIVRGDQLTLQAPYDQDFLEDFKQTIPYAYRKWDPDTKVWQVGCCQAELVSICRAHYGRVIVHDEDTKPPALAQAPDWAATMFDAVPARLQQVGLQGAQPGVAP